LQKILTAKNGQNVNFTKLVCDWREKLVKHALTKIVQNEVNDGELAAFISYAIAFPNDFLALVDTYDVLKFA